MQKGNNSDGVIGWDIGESLIIFVIVKKIILTDCCSFQSKVTSLISASIDERRDILDVKTRTTLIWRLITQRVAIVWVDNLKIQYIIV